MSDQASNLPVGMAGLRYPITQVSLAVRDLDATMEAWHRLFGWRPWNVFEHRLPMHHATELRGQPVHYALRGAEVYVGDLNFELLEPTEGPNLWSEFIAARGEGIASIAVMFREVADGEAVKAAFRERFDIPVTMLARIGDHIEYYYLGTEERFGCLIESGSGHAIDFVRPAYEFPRPATPPSARPVGLDFAITQVSLVVRDLDAVVEAYREAFGWGPWSRSESRALAGSRLRGVATDFAVRWAQAQVGDLNVEVIEPQGGGSPWQAHLDTKGEGLISIGLSVADARALRAAREHATGQGIEVLAEARVGGTDWLLLDTERDLKCLVGLGTAHARTTLEPANGGA